MTTSIQKILIKNRYIYKFLLKFVNFYYKLKFLYNKFKTRTWLHIKFLEYIHIQNPYQTINQVIYLLNHKISWAYLRFWDGDINLLENKSELLQPSNNKLTKEMFETFTLWWEWIMKCLPLHSLRFWQSPGMKYGLHSSSDDRAVDILLRTYKYFIWEKIYSHVALSYLAVYDYEYTISFLKLLKSFSPILVWNQEIPETVVNCLFGKWAIHIKTPQHRSYDDIDRIEEELLSHISIENFSVVVVAMWCSWRVLEKRIIKKWYPIFLFDFGSLMDIFCWWNTRAWMDLIEVPSWYWEKMLKEV